MSNMTEIDTIYSGSEGVQSRHRGVTFTMPVLFLVNYRNNVPIREKLVKLIGRSILYNI